MHPCIVNQSVTAIQGSLQTEPLRWEKSDWWETSWPVSVHHKRGVTPQQVWLVVSREWEGERQKRRRSSVTLAPLSDLDHHPTPCFLHTCKSTISQTHTPFHTDCHFSFYRHILRLQQTNIECGGKHINAFLSITTIRLHCGTPVAASLEWNSTHDRACYV